jgi:hypothetical protein
MARYEAKATKSGESNMKHRIMTALVGCALLFGGKSVVWAVDALFGTYAFAFNESAVTAFYSDGSSALCGYNSGTTSSFYSSSGSGWITTNLAVIYGAPNDPFVNCVTNCGESFVANSIFLVYSNSSTLGEVVAQPLTGATNGIVNFTNLAANEYGVCFLPDGWFIIGGSFSRPGGYAISKNIAYVSSNGVIQNMDIPGFLWLTQAK